MLSYQHAYHAGNAADLHKHIALAELLARLTAKARGITVMESHAGRGLYDLAGAEAAKTGEAAAGIGRVRPGKGTFWRALAAIRAAHGAAAYPGSPLVAQTLLRPQDRLVLCELHPGEYRALRQAMAGAGPDDPSVEIHKRDGHEGVVALSPPVPRRGLVLLDPSYEVKDEYAATGRTACRLLAKWPEAAVMIWYPILPAGRDDALLAALDPVAEGMLHHRAAFREAPERGMTGSGIVLLNAPWGIEEVLDRAWAEAGAVLAL